MSQFLISAAHKSSGKTTLSIGLCAALKARGLRVQAFKKGPDYIDPMWLGAAAGRPCFNLDFNTQAPDEMLAEVMHRSQKAEVTLIEGNKGLYDGMALDGANSNAALARLLGYPVVLVIDTRGMTRGVAPLLLGYQAFDAEIDIQGVILNQVGGSRHEGKLREAVEYYTDIPVLGAVRRDPRLNIDERHLGLMPSNEAERAAEIVQEFGEIIGSQVDLDRLLKLSAPPLRLAPPATAPLPATADYPPVRIGIARDRAFGFYYPDDLEALERAGAELVPFDTLRDPNLPQVDGLFIGGGFPETAMRELEANAALRRAIRQAIEDGLPCYAECGGLMYLSRSIRWRGEQAEMVGVVPADTLMEAQPQGRGYIRIRETADFPWPAMPGETPAEIAAHEFHYSRLENLAPDARFAYQVLRGSGIDGRHDGFLYKNLLACYAHLRNTGACRWAERFVAFVRDCNSHRRQEGAPISR